MSSKKGQAGDERFLRAQRDPRFWEMPERERKIKIDKRFKSMFHDQRFKVTYTVDKRGRPINHTSTDDLKRFYKLSDSEVDDEEDEKKAAEGKKKRKAKEKLVKAETQGRGGKAEGDPERSPGAVEDDGDDDEEDVDLRHSIAAGIEEDDAENEDEASSGSDEESGSDSDSDSGPDLARGKGNVETSSDEDDEDDTEAVLRQEEEQIEHDWGELSKDAPRSEEVSARLAVCNMDWQRIKAVDLLALFRSFTPEGGAVLSVKIYPSEFGKERLKREETQGPLELKALPDDSEDDTEEERVHREKLRDYQFKRLKYYYAVVECDSVHTAAKIYEDCDGYEYETSCSMLDLRFIPEDVTFEEEPKDVASDVNLSGYTPNLFTSSASATSKAKLTWDETDHERVTALNRKFNKDELLEMDFNAYLASSSDEEDEDGDAADDKQTGDAVEQEVKKKSEEKISKYRELLKGIQDKDKKLQEDKDMEVTWVPGLKEATEQLVKKKLEGKDKLTPWEEYLQKKKEKKKLKKSQRKLRTGADELSDDELPPDVDLSDPFFSEELGPDLKKKQKKTAEEEERTEEEEEELERQKAEMVLLMEDDANEAKHKHFNYDKIVEQQNLSKKKRKKLLKKGEEPLDDGFQVDVKDPRFQAMFTSHLYNLDPSHPSYKKTKATETILAEKQRRREAGEQAEPVSSQREAAGRKQNADASATKKPMDPSLSLLVRSIKSKTGQFQARKKRKLVQL